MLRSLPGDSAQRIRLLGKFVEKKYEKIDRLIRLRRDYAAKVSAIDQSIKKERNALSAADQEDLADEWLSRRLDAGLFLAWLIAEDDGARSAVKELLAERDESFVDIKNTIQGPAILPTSGFVVLC